MRHPEAARQMSWTGECDSKRWGFGSRLGSAGQRWSHCGTKQQIKPTCYHSLRGSEGERTVEYVVLVILAMGIFARAFIAEAAKHLFNAVFKRARPKDQDAEIVPEPIEANAVEDVEVPHNYEETLYELGSCAWVPTRKVAVRELEGYKHVSFPGNGGKTYRTENTGRQYLMTRPGAVLIDNQQ